MPPAVRDATSPLCVVMISIFQNSVRTRFASSYHKSGTATLPRKGTCRLPESWGACRSLCPCSSAHPQCHAPKVVVAVQSDAERAEMNSSSPASGCSISCYSKTPLRPKTESAPKASVLCYLALPGRREDEEHGWFTTHCCSEKAVKPLHHREEDWSSVYWNKTGLYKMKCWHWGKGADDLVSYGQVHLILTHISTVPHTYK